MKKLSEKTSDFISLRFRLLIIFVSLAFIPILCITILSIFLDFQRESRQIFNKLNAISSLKENEINTWLDNQKKDLRTIMESREYSSLMINFHEDTQLDIQQPPYQEMVEYLQRLIFITGSYDEIFILSSQGRVVLSTDQWRRDEYRGLQPYFKEGLFQTGVHVQTLSYSSTSEGINSIIVVIPIKDVSNNPSGVLCGRVSLSRLNEIMHDSTGMGESGETYLVGSNKILLTQSRYPDFPVGGTFIASVGVTNALDNGQYGQGTYLDYRQVKVVGVYRWIQSIQCVLASEIDWSETFEPMFVSLRFHIVIALITVGIAILASIVFSRMIASPISSLVGTAALISQGKLNVKAQVERRDEIGVLADTFNQMTANLSQLINGLEQEVAERKRVESKLLLTQFTVDHAGDATFQIDSSGKILYANNAACSSLGYSRDELVGRGISDLDPDYPYEKWQDYWEDLSTKGYLSFESSHKKRNGDVIPVEISANYVQTDSEEYIFEFSRDITKRKVAEDKRKQLEEQLRQSQKLEAIGQLAGGVAHDFNNMLTGIIASAELLEQSQDDSESSEYISFIIDSAVKAASLTGQLLTFSRRKKRESVPVDIHNIVHNVFQMLNRTVDKRITMTSELNAEYFRILGDSAMIHNAILNLCINACDAMPEGGMLKIVTGNIELQRATATEMHRNNLDDGHYISITIADTGYGIAESKLERIFEPFFTTKSPEKGTGLGLSVTYGTILDHKGSITVSSEQDKGTEFVILLPVLGETLTG